MVNKSAGRPRGGSDARERILAAARMRFEQDGYAAVSVRSIAREAGVDHSLVNYHFGSKEALFGHVLAIGLTPGEVMDRVFAAGDDHLAERLVATAVTVWDQPVFSGPLLGVLRSADGDAGLRQTLATFISTEVHGRLREHIGGPDASAHTTAVVTVMAGLIFSRYVLAAEPMASMSREKIVATLAPMLAPHLGRRSSSR
ncbi:TetR/AcrR family transcriptional regulator [Allobranchiibius sp. CTAmp26]|uniref:TetR/AcrR family transcriptional regulator n=1 Tax=Allobranchiibius sp. CTAmp26 TaxID=2815214 RepID=UPI001AA0B586|nr:TetR family transcriptional regulator [Allobranchiibius sp. CTAmp26]MBO1754825.1 TetR family transcriptional regulator [Allobranchiibius sp. CTAmp26]